MDLTRNQPSARKFWTWFIPLRRDIGSWAFALNRVTAIGLTIYLFLHLFILGKLAQGPGAYDEFLLLTEHPLIKLGEWLVVAAGILHGLNGIRIVLTTLGVGITRQKQLFYGLMLLAGVIILFFTIRMY
jgi:succinate dehydrogenase / fumarate reductase cytochrome b subunit